MCCPPTFSFASTRSCTSQGRIRTWVRTSAYRGLGRRTGVGKLGQTLSKSCRVTLGKTADFEKKMVDYNSFLKIYWYTRRWRSGANCLPFWTWLTCQCRLFHHFLRVSSISAECHAAGFPCETGTWLSESKSSLNCWRWHRKQCWVGGSSVKRK